MRPKDFSLEAPAFPRRIRPPLKWAGSKYRILDAICKVLPHGNRLVEPFVGSGAVFLNTEYERYLINDVNKDLILFYKVLKKEGTDFIAYCAGLFTPGTNKEPVFYRLREEFNRVDDPVRKAALFLYVNKHGYNGLCRYNAAGEFNVPFGRYAEPYFPRKEMEYFLTKRNRLRIENDDFESIMRSAKKGDVIYCDPPYIPLSATSNFTAYSAGGFSETDQRRLALLAEETAGRGVPVLISNHRTEFTERIYKNAHICRFSVRRLISCNGSKREHADELLALYP